RVLFRSWHRRRPLVAVLDRLARRLADRLLQDLVHDRAPEDLLDMRDGHLALAESLEVNLVLDLVQVRRVALADLLGVHHDLELPLQPFRTRLQNLHDVLLPSLARSFSSASCEARRALGPAP